MKKHNILVLNVGSSSLKFSLFENETEIISGKCDKISGNESYIELGKERTYLELPSYAIALKEVKSILTKKGLTFTTIAHRVVHGGTLTSTCKITSSVEKIIKEYSEFAPLHNPVQLEVILACKKFKLPQFAVFDTSFYANLPKLAQDFPIPREIVKKHKLRKYGFHGTSHKSAVANVKGKVISCHLGNGSSITASLNGKPMDTSMALTPLAGVVMATRSGDLDPGLILLLQSKGYELNTILNKQSGFKAYSKYTDIREMLANLNNPNVQFAFDMFVYSIVKYIGSYSAVLNGVDSIIFTGGIGEHIPKIRASICNQLSYLGVSIDPKKNILNAPIISSKKSKVTIQIKVCDEQLQIAREVLELLN
jgi:acetate kinase